MEGVIPKSKYEQSGRKAYNWTQKYGEGRKGKAGGKLCGINSIKGGHRKKKGEKWGRLAKATKPPERGTTTTSPMQTRSTAWSVGEGKKGKQPSKTPRRERVVPSLLKKRGGRLSNGLSWKTVGLKGVNLLRKKRETDKRGVARAGGGLELVKKTKIVHL